MIEEKPKKKISPYAFDFDGVIAQYSGFKGIHTTGEPNPEVVKAIRQLKAEGHKIIIFSTRGEALLRKYCSDHDIPVDYFNRNPELEGENPGKPISHVYIDDRSICYNGQTAEELVNQIKNFKTYWEIEKDKAEK